MVLTAKVLSGQLIAAPWHWLVVGLRVNELLIQTVHTLIDEQFIHPAINYEQAAHLVELRIKLSF